METYEPDPDHPEFARVRRALADPPPRAVDAGELRRAAVLAPLFSLGGELNLLFTLRSSTLRHHAAQISFPGGGIEATDPDPLSSALREMREELGLDADAVQLLGRLDDAPTRTGFHIIPFVGALTRPFSLIPREEEVAEVFHLPLASFRVPGAPGIFVVEHQGRSYKLLAYTVEGRVVWGATAWIMKNLLERLYGPEPRLAGAEGP